MDQPKAVLCDDDRTTTLILKRLLEKAGFTVFVGGNGKEGLALVGADHPRLLVLYPDMPVKNGIQVLTELKQSGESLPQILVLTAHESPEDEAQVKSLGALEMVVKPFKPSELVLKLQGLAAAGGGL
jgi:two-component system, OmpR family, response regulator VicR